MLFITVIPTAKMYFNRTRIIIQLFLKVMFKIYIRRSSRTVKLNAARGLLSNYIHIASIICTKND